MPEQFFWCPRCERTVLGPDLGPDGGCPVCGQRAERISWLTAALRKVPQGPARGPKEPPRARDARRKT